MPSVLLDACLYKNLCGEPALGSVRTSRSSHRRCSVRKVVLRNFAGLRPATLLKKRLWYRCFPVNFAKFLRTPFLTEHLRWLLLEVRTQPNAGFWNPLDLPLFPLWATPSLNV